MKGNIRKVSAPATCNQNQNTLRPVAWRGYAEEDGLCHVIQKESADHLVTDTGDAVEPNIADALADFIGATDAHACLLYTSDAADE